jgi:DNA-binding PadR family transcriptional regulator
MVAVGGHRSTSARRLERANEPGVLILTSLASGAKHGYALAKDIEGFAGVTLGPGTLYGAITRLEARGLIEPMAGDDRRRPYRITAAGRAALTAAVREMRLIADEGATRLGLAFSAHWLDTVLWPTRVGPGPYLGRTE